MTKFTPLTLLGLAASANAFFLMPCWPVSTQRVDPIVNPGQVSPHVHQIAGGDGFAPAMNYSDTQAASCTTCFVKGDHSNYWIPAMFIKHQDGTFERVPQVGSASMYYFNEASRLGAGEKMESFPKGLRMLAGDPEKRSPGADAESLAINYKCLDYSGTPTDSKTFPAKNCPDGVRAEVTYPSCWDGKNLDSADHKSHMAYPTGTFESGSCPSTHPHHLVTLKVEFIFDTNSFKDQWSGSSQPFVWANGDPTGYGLHADYVMGWDFDLLSKAVAQCFDEYGVLANCAPFAGQIQSAYVNPDTCKVDSFVSENIDGKLSKMPGCNTIQSGPGAATKATCGDTVKLLGNWANSVAGDLIGSLGLGNDTDSDSSTLAATSALSSSVSTASVAPQAFYAQDSPAAPSQSATTSVAPVAPAPSSPSSANYRVVTVTDIITETTYTTEYFSRPTTNVAAAAPSPSAPSWGKWRREIGDNIHKHQLRHLRHRRREHQY